MNPCQTTVHTLFTLYRDCLFNHWLSALQELVSLGTITLSWWGLHVLVNLSAILSSGRVLHNKSVSREGPDKEWFMVHESSKEMKDQSAWRKAGPPSGAKPGQGVHQQDSGGQACHGARSSITQKGYEEASPSQGGLAGVGCAARWVARKLEGLSDRDLGSRSRLWGHGTSPLCGGRSQSWCRRWSAISWRWWSFPQRTGLILNPKGYEKDKSWTLFLSGVAKSLRLQVGVGILTSPKMSAAVLEFHCAWEL